MSDDGDSSDIFTEDATKSYYTGHHNFNSNMSVNKRIIGGYERSEGEIGAPASGEDMSHSDISRFPSNPRSVGLADRVAGGKNNF